MNMINVTIDGIKVQVPENSTVLDAAKIAKVDIPTLCYLKDINEIGACRMCVVDVGARSLQAACVYPVSEGLNVKTNTKEIRDARKVTLELILSNHDRSCLQCVRNKTCELQSLADQLNVRDIRFMGASEDRKPIDNFSPSITRDPNKCVLCRRCVSMCKNVQSVAVIDTMERGYNTIVSPAFGYSLNDVACVNCGQCINVCPVGALSEKDEIQKVWDALANNDLHVIVQTAPAVRAAIGEEFGMPIGSRATKNMIASLKKLGFDRVFDTNTAADLTIMEEGTELINRIKEGGKLPLVTSCSPGWIKFCEHNFPDMMDNLSTCKSPHQMLGAILKSYYAEKEGLNPDNIFVVSVMPCTAKKFESNRPEMNVDGHRDVDAVITTRELARMIKEAGINFVDASEDHFDDPMGDATGAGVIFGATGGVMEAAIRTAYAILEGEELEDINICDARGVEGIKELTLNLPKTGIVLKAAVAHGLGNARRLMEKVRSGEADYHFIEVMACPGGCVNGGGQPIQPAKVRNEIDLRTERAKAIYEEDEASVLRRSHENPTVQKLYADFLGQPCGHKSHELLHTHYTKRDLYPTEEK
ncbi:MAG TPA: ferredoxin [Clostridiales bacterium]|nr:ferredoxin [Clostridiales bacterium]